MAAWRTFEAISPILPDHCAPQDEFLAQLSSTFHICVPTQLALLSTLLGCLSIVSWLFAQLPQIVKNARLQSTAGLSIYFLVEWCLGDAANLAGAMLTSQATWQVVVAGYYVLVDVVLVAQYYFYSHYKSRTKEKLLQPTEGYRGHSGREGDFPDESIPAGQSPVASLYGGRLSVDGGGTISVPDRKSSIPGRGTPRASACSEKRSPTSSHSVPRLSKTSPHVRSSNILLAGSLACAILGNASPLPAPSGPFLTAQSAPSLTSIDLGSILSWLSTVLYLCSRLPQIFKNHRRRSTAGLSPHLFAAAFCGNLFYSTSLLANPLAWASYPPYGAHGWAPAHGSDRIRWITLAAPFWLGAAGVLLLDAVVGGQFFIFGDGEHALPSPVAVIPPGVEIDADTLARGRTQWRDLEGWMRGWVPSPTPSLRGIFWSAAAEQRPLLQSAGPTHAHHPLRPALRRVAGSGRLAGGNISTYGST